MQKGNFVIAPSWRYDIKIPEDLQEEVLRMQGYENIKPEMPVSTLIPAKPNNLVFWKNRAKDILVSLGFSEIFNYSLTQDKTGLKIRNQNKYLRDNLINQVKNAWDKNCKNFKQVRIFEIGKIYPEKWHLCVAALDAEEARGTLDILFDKLGLTSCPNNLVKFKNNIFELNFEKLAKLATEEQEYRPISKFPPVKRDLSILVNLDIQVDEILQAIQNIEPKLIHDVDLFDMYEGPELPDNKKSLAFKIIYQSHEHTLTDAEANKLHEKVMNNLEKNIKNLKVRR